MKWIRPFNRKANFYHTAGEYAEGKKARGEI